MILGKGQQSLWRKLWWQQKMHLQVNSTTGCYDLSSTSISAHIKWQCGAYSQLRENLKTNECLLHVHFSENYSCKYSQEIQSVHFGGSNNMQHYILECCSLQLQSPVTFCSISPSRLHDPPAIWAHLDPVLNMVREIPSNQSSPCIQWWPSNSVQTEGQLLTSVKKAS